MKILLVDDEVVALNALRKRVDWVKYGFTETFTAQNAVEAREILQKEEPDLVMCDIEMPGESGLELTEHIREAYPKIGVIMVTCHADFGYLKQSMKNKVYDYILKPIDYEELDTVLQDFLKEHQSAKQKQQIGELMDRTAQSRRKDEMDASDRMGLVKQYIEDHIQEKIYVEDLAKLVHVNEQYFMRLFKKDTGQSVTEYITERRIALAGAMLKNTDRTINFIADSVGCENYSYFTKLFKKYTGFTPREYRNQFRKET